MSTTCGTCPDPCAVFEFHPGEDRGPIIFQIVTPCGEPDSFVANTTVDIIFRTRTGTLEKSASIISEDLAKVSVFVTAAETTEMVTGNIIAKITDVDAGNKIRYARLVGGAKRVELQGN